MTNDEPGVGSKGDRSDAGAGPQTLAQMQGTEAEVVGSDRVKVGDLKAVGDADIVVGRPLLRSDLHVSVARVREVSPDNRVVLDVSAEEAKEARWGGPATDTSGGAEGFSESEGEGKGALELVEDDSQDTK